MELFTEIEFNEGEFNRIDEVRFKLGEEGWEEINEEKHHVLRAGEGRILKSVKYKYRRVI
jgi:hypothetical protein